MAIERKDTATFDNPADAAELAKITAATAAGGDPFGDNDDEDTPVAVATEPKPEPDPKPEGEQAEGEADAGEGDEALDTEGGTLDKTDPAVVDAAEEAAAVIAKAAEPAPVTAEAEPVVYKTRSAAELKAAREALDTKVDEAFEKFSDGSLSAKDYRAIERSTSDERQAIAEEAALLRMSEANQKAYAEAKIQTIMAIGKAEGIDYSNQEIAASFDAALAVLSTSAANKHATFGQLADKAHAMVRAMNGVTAAPAQVAKPAAQAKALPAKPPARANTQPAVQTLRNVPAAATPNQGGGLTEQLSRLSGLDFEDAVGRLTKAQRDALLDS